MRHSSFFTTGHYLQRALEKRCNLVTVYFGESSILYFLGSHYLGFVAEKLSNIVVDRLVKKVREDEGICLSGVLVVDPVRLPLHFKNLEVTKAYYAIDNCLSFNEHISRAKVADYDLVFVAQKDTIPKYLKQGCRNVVWLPPGADPSYHHPHNATAEYQVAFVGQYGNGGVLSDRDRFLTALRHRSDIQLLLEKAYLHDYAETLCKSKVVLNKSTEGDLNMRVFEVLACRRLLLTDLIGNGLLELFQDKKHLVTYHDLKDLVDLIKYYSCDDAGKEIAEIGQQEVLSKHTYDHRAETILSEMQLH